MICYTQGQDQKDLEHDMANSYATARSGGRMPPFAPSRKMGAWKLAYADFLTALCAFFLVMWMINTPQSDREGVAEYFSGNAQPVTYTSQPAHQADQVASYLAASPELQSHAGNISITPASRYVRLDLYDTSDQPLFASGRAGLNETGEALTMAAGRVIAAQNWQVTIEGHTDSNHIAAAGYSNWDLSAERANSARRMLESAGVASAQFRAVTGLSDTRPLFPDASYLPANRRISIVVHLLD